MIFLLSFLFVYFIGGVISIRLYYLYYGQDPDDETPILFFFWPIFVLIIMIMLPVFLAKYIEKKLR